MLKLTDNPYFFCPNKYGQVILTQNQNKQKNEYERDKPDKFFQPYLLEV